MGFATEAFCRRAVQAFNEDAQACDAARGWSGDFGIVVDGLPDLLVVHVGAPRDGVLPEPRFVTLAELIQQSPTYYARASEASWRALLLGTLDPVTAILEKRLEARGDLTPVITRLKYRGVLERWVQRMTEGGLA